ncbi:hypothetical protein SAMN05444680_11699 [Variovorax sp. YR216]|nr:hypothetical protein SAMN05444680_11699 [Variovorax sp. YR216]
MGEKPRWTADKRFDSVGFALALCEGVDEGVGVGALQECGRGDR